MFDAFGHLLCFKLCSIIIRSIIIRCLILGSTRHFPENPYLNSTTVELCPPEAKAISYVSGLKILIFSGFIHKYLNHTAF